MEKSKRPIPADLKSGRSVRTTQPKSASVFGSMVHQRQVQFRQLVVRFLAIELHGSERLVLSDQEIQLMG